MSEIEKIKRYVERHKAPNNPHYSASTRAMLALIDEMSPMDAICLAFIYGRAKGYRMAKAEARK